MKEISSGLIITDGSSFLGCKITGQDIYDIPKGHIDGNETPEQACVREVMEETGLKIDRSKIVSLGLHKYTPKKDLHLFYLFVDRLPDIDQLWCSSTFVHPKSGREIPEINGYKHIRLDEIDSHMGKSMNATLENIFNMFGDHFNEDGYLLLLAKTRIANAKNEEKYINQEEVLRRCGITEEELDQMDVDIE